MNTFLTDSDLRWQQECEQFAQEKLAPLAPGLAKRTTNMNALIKQLAEKGYLSLNVPLEYNGQGQPFLYVVLLAEALAKYDAGVAVYLAYHTAAIELIKEYGTAEQKNVYLPQLAKGNLLGTVAHNESHKKSHNGSHNESNQEKILMVRSCPGDISLPNLVLLYTAGNFFLLEKIDAAEIEIKDMPITTGLSSVYFVQLSLKNESIKKLALKNKLSEQGTSDTSVSYAADIIKTLLAGASLGIAEEVLTQTTAYVKVNERNGQALAQSQAMQWKLADSAVESSADRLLVYRAAWSKDEDSANFSLYAAMCKAYAAAVASHHSGEGLQILLPLLDNNDSSFARYYLDSKMLETFEKPNDEEKVILSNILGI